MKEGWEYKKLGEVTTTINGLWTGKKPPFINVAVVRNTNFTKDCKLDMTNVAYLDVELKQYSTRKLLPGDIIVEKSGGSDKQPVGRPVLFDLAEGDFSFSNFTSTLRINDFNVLSPKYLHYALYNAYLRGETFKMQSKTTGIHNLDFKAYNRLYIPVPPLSEQQHIVEELDLLSSIIEKKKAQLKELDNLAQSIFYEMFGDPVTNEKGWEVKKLGDIGLVKTGPFGSILHKEDYISNGIPLVNPIHMKGFRVVADMNFTISNEKAEDLCNYILHKNDIVFARRGDIGRCAVISENENGYLCGTGSLFVRFEIDVDSYYIMYMIRCESFTKDIILKARGVTMLNINSNTISNLTIPLPPLPLQELFASKILSIEHQKALIKQSITEVETLFNSRMDYYFN